MKKIIILTLLLAFCYNSNIKEEYHYMPRIIEEEKKPITAVLKGKEVETKKKEEKKEIIKYPVILTGYDNCYSCTQSGKGITASGKVANRGTVAAPKSIKFGTKITIKNAPKNIHSYRVVEDRGGAINVKNGIYHFDLWFNTHKEALNFGKRKAKMYWLDNEIIIEM